MKRRADVRRAPDPVVAAGDLARDLGHKTMTVGRTVSCWHCAMDGIVGPDGTRIGTIFERSCAK